MGGYPVYEEPTQGDGSRVLGRPGLAAGLTMARAALDEWCKDIAPSAEQRKWCGHDPGRFRSAKRPCLPACSAAKRIHTTVHCALSAVCGAVVTLEASTFVGATPVSSAPSR